MASTNAAASATINGASLNARRRSQRAERDLQRSDGQPADGSRAGKRVGRGRGARNGPASGRQDSTQTMQAGSRNSDVDASRACAQGTPELAGTPNSRLTADAAEGQNDGEIEAEVCFICASDIVHQSVAPCNHRTCHICSLRMRALYKSRLCPHCRTEADTVIFTDDSEKRYEDFASSDFVHVDGNLGISYEKKEIEDDTILLLRYNCPDPSCDVACFSWPDLHRHVRSVHQKQMCDLCTRNKKVFTHEHELYTKEELRRHEKSGDQKEDQTGFKGHPECGFCRQRFYGDDELYVHCREKHEKCHICERSNPQRQHQYYVNYDALEQHFRKDHFLCLDQECLDKKFVVFASEMDLKAHQLEAHPNGLTKDARRDARRVDMTAFDYRQPIDDRPDRRRNARGGRGGGRGRDPNAEPLPPSSAQPMRRDEIAYQRQMAIQSAQSVTTRTFGGQLTSTEPQIARAGNRLPAPETVSVPRTASAPTEAQPAGQTRTDEIVAFPSTPQEQARQIQHNAVIQRASQMLGNDPAKIKTFRDRISSYKDGTLSASQMVDAFLALFDVAAAELGKLIKELADLYDNEQRRNNLLKAWNDWRAINEDYPSLPGPSGSQLGANTASTGRRILKLKSSTAQSQRAPASQSRTWGTIATTGAGAVAATSRSATTVRHTTGQTAMSSWSNQVPAPVSISSITASLHVRSVPPARDAFPSLPSAPKPNTSMAGLHRGAVSWLDRGTTPTNAWAASGIAPTDLSMNENDTGEGNDSKGGGNKKKGRKGKQTTLYHFG